MKHLFQTLFAAPALFLATVSPAFSQGDLAPPPGAPAPTMKSLDQIEARTPLIDSSPGVTVNFSSGFITISAAGSYYLTKNHTMTGSGIRITSSNVTVDLNGFTIIGSNTSSSNRGLSIKGTSTVPLRNVEIKNGSVEGFGASVSLEHASGNVVRDLRCSKPGSWGILIDATNGVCNGNRFADCSINDAGLDGFFCSSNSGSECNSNTLTGCVITGSTYIAVKLRGNGGICNGNTISDCVISGGTNGIELAGFGANECDGNTVIRNTIDGIGGTSFHHGIYVTGDSNRIEANQVNKVTAAVGSTSFGIRIKGSHNLTIKNVCTGSKDNFTFDSGNTYGPEESTSGALSGTNPWANFNINETP